MASSGSGLEHLLAEGVISEVLARLQSGKEAEVYVVRFGGNVVAAKVYKDRAQRSFKNNSSYKEGRAVRNSRSQRAMDRGSKFGKAAAEDAWKTAEADALYKLHAAEVRVPTPVLYLDGVLLMELVLDAHGNAARRLIDTQLTVAEANSAYHDMLGQLVRILSCDMIHGDLSPYNVLWAATGPTIIDFPQIVSASHNSSSEQFFLRDADNILGHLARIDQSLLSRRGDPREIWNAYRRRELTPEFRPTGQARPAYAQPRAFSAEGRGHPRPGANADRPQGHDRPAQTQTHDRHGGNRPPQPNRPPHASDAAANRPPQPNRPPQQGARPSQQGRGPGGPRQRVHMPEVIVRHATGGSAPPQPAIASAPPPQRPARQPRPQQHQQHQQHQQLQAPAQASGAARPNDRATSGGGAGERTEGTDHPSHRRRRRRR